jgi:hypothetical protein
LGSAVKETGTCDTDTGRRLAMGRTAVQTLKNIRRSRDIIVATKLDSYKHLSGRLQHVGVVEKEGLKERRPVGYRNSRNVVLATAAACFIDGT